MFIISCNYNVTIVISYYCNLVTFQTIIPSYKLLVTKQVTSYITSYFKSNQLRNLVTKVTSYPQLCPCGYQMCVDVSFLGAISCPDVQFSSISRLSGLVSHRPYML